MNNKAVIMCVEGINNLNNNINGVKEMIKMNNKKNIKSEIMTPLTYYFLCVSSYLYVSTC